MERPGGLWRIIPIAPIQTIDLGTSPPTVYGPFLGGQLGTTGALGDVAITPIANMR